EGVEQAVRERADHGHPQEYRERRGALGLRRVVPVHRHVAHDWPPVLMVVCAAGALAGSPSRTKRSLRVPSSAGSWKRSFTGRIIGLATKPTKRTPTMM